MRLENTEPYATDYLVGCVVKSEQLHQSGKIAESLDVIYDVIDDYLIAAKFSSINSVLFVLKSKVRDLPEDIVLALLTTTLAAKSKLPWRSDFYLAVRECFGDKELSGLA